ncbi:YchJ family metal-binding protein [Breoghania sp.]|uniref:YchJ family protein n=1 Tax=Breoghania sp. TaxID=2065378 RepID=UPI0029C9C042|nr:YchJ family metal-binding protein [Breoghania sp.]
MTACPCCSGKDYELCCGPALEGRAWPETAEALMRSRYTAFARRDVKWLKQSLWPKYQKTLDMEGLTEFAQTREWVGLEIERVAQGGVDDKTGMVRFVAKALSEGTIRDHREASLFRKKNKRWYYVAAIAEDQANVLLRK